MTLTKKKVKLSQVADVWKDFVQIEIVNELIKHGKVQIDKNIKMEIVGKRAIKPILIKKTGKIQSTTKANPMRSGIIYKLTYTDSTFKNGKLIFTATPDIKLQISKALMTTSNYYKIVA